MNKISKLCFFLLLLFAHLSCSAEERNIHWEALANQIVNQLSLETDEKVILIKRLGLFEEIVPHLRYAVMEAGGIDLGVIEVLDKPEDSNWDGGIIGKSRAKSRNAYVHLLENVDVGIMLPGTHPGHPAYKAFQTLLVEKAGPRRTIHLHWTDRYNPLSNISGLTGVFIVADSSTPPMSVIDNYYQRAILDIDYQSMTRTQLRFADAMRHALVRVTSPIGTDISFRIAQRPIVIQNGNASARHMQKAVSILDREIELPAGVIRVAPLEESVEGIIVYPASLWNAQPVEGLQLTFSSGVITGIEAENGQEHAEAELGNVADANRMFREFALGFNPELAVSKQAPWIPYYGYGAGVVRLGIGNNQQLLGKVGGPYYRWRDLFIDCTVTLDGKVWVENGKLLSNQN
jgi:hypothetical protein